MNKIELAIKDSCDAYNIIKKTLAYISLNQNIVKKMIWSIRYIEGVGTDNREVIKSIPDFEEMIDSSDKGKIVNFGELLFLINQYTQINDILIVGYESEKKIVKCKYGSNFYLNCEISFEILDSGIFIIYYNDAKYDKEIKKIVEYIKA